MSNCNMENRLARYSLFILLLGVMVSACSSESPKTTHSFQAISALGDTLYAPKIEPDTRQRFETNLSKARADYQAKPDDANAIIWYGRREAYLGNYRKAIAIFTEGIKKHPDDPRLYRHRGHRYITVRKFDKAIADLKKASVLIKGTKDQIEPDGLPNSQNMPRSTLHTNIWYHLGLAYYLTGNFEAANSAFRNCLDASTNDDMRVAAAYWLYMSLRRDGKDEKAGDILELIRPNMDLIENDSYHKLLLVFKGVFDGKSLLNDTATPLGNATIGYGLGNWHYINGRTQRAHEIFEKVYKNRNNWPAFGYIAAETDLARIKWQ